jgi:hypothetical protein
MGILGTTIKDRYELYRGNTMRFLAVALLAASLLTVSACTAAKRDQSDLATNTTGGSGRLDNSTVGEGSPAVATPTPAPSSTTFTGLPPLGGIGQLAFRPGSYERAPGEVMRLAKSGGSGGIIINPALYGNYATRYYKGHTLLFADTDEFLVASDLLPLNSAHHVGPGDNLVLYRVPRSGLCWYLRDQEPRQYVVTSSTNAGTRTASPTLIEAVDGSLTIVTKVPFCGATP